MGVTLDARGRACCDGCGAVRGVRKRKCPYLVLGDSLRSPSRFKMHYCSPPRYCAMCYSAAGGLRGVHGEQCREGAALSQAEYDARQVRLDAGDWHVVSASGDWRPDVPAGQVRVTFWTAGGPARGERTLLVPESEYNPTRRPWLSDYAVPGGN